MSSSGPGRAGAAATALSGASTRFVGVWRDLPAERRLAAAASGGLFLSLFLPWYQTTVIASGVTALRSVSDSTTGWGAFSFVEAAVLLVAAGVLALLYIRAHGRAFHVPGGDGGVITAAGGWTCFLVIWRIFDKQGVTGHGQYATTDGIEWGIFVALAVAAVLTYAGTRIRLAHEPEPPLPGEVPAFSPGVGTRRGERARTERGAAAGAASSGARTWPVAVAEPATEPAPDTRRRRPRDADETRSTEPLERSARPVRAPDRDDDAPPRSRRPAGGETERTADDGPRRIRPRSVGEPGTGQSGPARETPPPHRPDREGAARPQERPSAPDASRRPRDERLSRREIQDLDIAEPPTSRLRRSDPATMPLRRSSSAERTTGGSPNAERRPAGDDPDDPDDQLTMRLD